MNTREDENKERINQSGQPRYYQQVKRTGNQKTKWFAFGCLTAFLLLLVFFIVLLSGLFMLGRRRVEPLRAGTFLNIQISGIIEEHRELDQDIFMLSRTFSARELIDKIDTAAADHNISGIILEPTYVFAGYSTLNEIIIALNNFRNTGKPVYAYLEMASNRDYYLASVADQIFLHPSASSGIFLSGIGISSLYMKDFFEKLGIEMTVLHAGDYKGAGETFDRMEMSPEFRESITPLIDDLYGQLLQDIARNRDMPSAMIQQVYEERNDLLVNQNYALEMEIVDHLSSRENMLLNLGIDKNRLIRTAKYQIRTPRAGINDKIAVVYLQGMITVPAGGFRYDFISSQKVQRIIDLIERDPNIRGVVLRINSPGGSALESEKIYQQIVRLNRVKPIVISMGDTAASGGYYIAVPGDFIYADPYTITGSIGVAAMIPSLHGAAEKIGVNAQSIYRGKFTNFMNLWENPQHAEIEALQRTLDSTYNEFKDRVAEGRSMPPARVENVAQGRIWSSKGALDNDLVDAIGTLDQAIEKTSELAGIEQYRTIYLPKTQTIWELLLERRFDFTAFIDQIRIHILSNVKLESIDKVYRVIEGEPLQMLSPIFDVE